MRTRHTEKIKGSRFVTSLGIKGSRRRHFKLASQNDEKSSHVAVCFSFVTTLVTIVQFNVGSKEVLGLGEKFESEFCFDEIEHHRR
jgi:hypothetical protein